MKLLSLFVCLSLTFAMSPVLAQDVSASAWRLGVGWRTGMGQQAGLEVHRDLRRGALSVRAEGGLVFQVADGAQVAYYTPGPDVDARTARMFGNAGLAAELGPRTARGDRTWFLLAGAGYGVARWGDGEIWSGQGMWPSIDPEGTTSAAPLVNLGLGWEFPLLGARQRVELRFERFHDRDWAVDGARISFARSIGR